MDDPVSNSVVDEFAQRLLELRDEWTDSQSDCNIRTSNSTLDTQFSLFTCPFGSKALSDVGDTWKGENHHNYGFDWSYPRSTDSPKTWPILNVDTDSNFPSYSVDSGLAGSCWVRESAGDGMTKMDVEEWVNALKPPTPRPGYICRICHQDDHYVQNCPKQPRQTNTSYQGPNGCFGMFSCDQCDHQWHSYKSRAEMGQICHRCQHLVYPQKQYPLDKIPLSKLKLANGRITTKR